MSIKSFLARKWAQYIRKKIDLWAKDPIPTQERILSSLIQKAKNFSNSFI